MIAYVLLLALSCCIIVLSVRILWREYKSYRDFWEKFNKFNGDRAWPLIGHANQFLTDDLGVIANVERMHRDYGYSTFRVQLGRCCAIFLTNPETCEVILRSNKEIHKSGDYTFLIDWLGEGLFMSNGKKGRFIRKAITPMLHFKTLENFIDAFETKGNILMEKLSEHKGTVFNVHHLMTLCSLDIICEAVMGVDIKAQENPDSEYACATYCECELFKGRLMSSWKRVQFLYYFTSDYRKHLKNIKVLHSLTNHIVKCGKDNYSEQEPGPIRTFLDMLLSIRHPDGTSLSNHAVSEEVNSLLFGGHETISITLSFVAYSLANNPDIQKKAYQEQLDILGSNTSVTPTYKDLENMKYLERVIKESLRLYPPAPIYSRFTQDDVELPDGSIIPAGCQAVISPYFMARNPKHYPNPYVFDPDRFLPENTRKRHPFSLLAFSAGPRNCVGQKFAMIEMKCILSKLLRRFELLPGGPGTELQITMEVLLKSKNGIQIGLKDR